MKDQGTQFVEDIDIDFPDQALAYLRTNGLVPENDTPTLRVLAGGVSNRTLLVEPQHGAAFVLKQALPKLRVATDWFSDPMRIHREAMGLRLLQELCPAGTITPLLFEDTSRHIIAMVAVPQPHCNWKEQLLAEGPIDGQVLDFAEILGTIHRRSSQLAPVLGAFDDWAWFESLRLEPYYEFTAVQVKEAAVFLTQLLKDTRRTRLALVHGDYSPKNILVYEKRLILIDHEVVHFGDPAFDVGFSLTHLLGKALHCQRDRKLFLEAAQTYVKRYLEMVAGSGFDADLESRACRHTLGCQLARVAGRSTLEYLTLAERHRQRKLVLNLMRETPIFLSELIREFGKELDCQ